MAAHAKQSIQISEHIQQPLPWLFSSYLQSITYMYLCSVYKHKFCGFHFPSNGSIYGIIHMKSQEDIFE